MLEVRCPSCKSRPAWARGLKRQCRRKMSQNLLSRPAWARGLKPFTRQSAVRRYGVAPCMGAWIETASPVRHQYVSWSRPAWARGLKQFSCCDKNNHIRSRPAWARGLKLTLTYIIMRYNKSRPAWARGLKLQITKEILLVCRSRPAWARGLKLFPGRGQSECQSRALHGRVD